MRRPAATLLLAGLLLLGRAPARADGPAPAPPAAPAPPPTPPPSSTAAGSLAKPSKATRRDLALRLLTLDEAIRARPEAFAARRRPTAEAMSRATMAFFTGAFAQTMDGLSEATAALRGMPWDRTVAALSRMRVDAPVVATVGAASTLDVRLVPLAVAPPEDVSVAVLATWAGDDAATGDARTALAALPAEPLARAAGGTLRVRTPSGTSLRPGRHRIEVRLRIPRADAPRSADPRGAPAPEDVLLFADVAVVGDDASARFDAARFRLGLHPKAPAGTPAGVRPTLERLVGRIEAALDGQVSDVVPDVADELRRLEEGAEALENAVSTGRAYVPSRAALSGSSHRRTEKGKAYRLYVPPPSDGGGAGPLPLVVALHGLGGNEDMYFEAYGAGEALRQCVARGWILAAPEDPKDAIAVAEDVRTLLDVDPRRIHLTGHSMGASAGWAALGARPGLWASFAPVAGGGVVPTSKPESAREAAPPVLAVTGDLDFGRGGTLATAERAKAAGLDVEVRVLPDLDHLLVVGASLPDLFAWFAAHPRK